MKTDAVSASEAVEDFVIHGTNTFVAPSLPDEILTLSKKDGAHAQEVIPVWQELLFFTISCPLALWFALNFPYVASWKAETYYVPTSFNYTTEESRFDNSAWTVS